MEKSEREVQLRSPLIKTSRKKLQPLARQIAGKKLSEAMVQMRFSKKRAAVEVLRHLEYARNRANLGGMGLGLEAKNVVDARVFNGEAESGEGVEGKKVEAEETVISAEGVQIQQTEVVPGTEPQVEPEIVVVRDRKGRRQVIDDRSDVYVDQAWVGHGKWEYGMDHRARGQIHRLYKPFTSKFSSRLLTTRSAYTHMVLYVR